MKNLSINLRLDLAVSEKNLPIIESGEWLGVTTRMRYVGEGRFVFDAVLVDISQKKAEEVAQAGPTEVKE